MTPYYTRLRVLFRPTAPVTEIVNVESYVLCTRGTRYMVWYKGTRGLRPRPRRPPVANSRDAQNVSSCVVVKDGGQT